MLLTLASAAAVSLAISLTAPPQLPPPEAAGGLGGGGPLHQHTSDCITPLQRAMAESAAEEFLSRHGGYNLRVPPVYAFYPQAGTLNRDLFMVNYVDLNPGAGILDYECTAISYNGHGGHDSSIRNFTEQAIGVPIFAAADGVVVATDDGHPDMNTQWLGQPANYVIIDHGSGRQGWYWHMRNGSVAVAPGQFVRAGRQIGLTASSGNSSGPHLHFESRQSGQVYEPFAGACRAGPSGWTDQAPLDRSFSLWDFGFTPTDLNNSPQFYPPFTLPRTGHLAFSEVPHFFWIYASNLPAASTWRVRYIRPSGTVAFTSPLGNFGATQPYYRSSWWYWWYTIPEMGSTPGDWRMQLEINGQIAIDAPVEVRPTRSPTYNRPPAPVTAAFDPPAPDEDTVLFARVNASLALDDPDYDIVRFRYLWRINGVVARDVTSAAHSDALAAGMAVSGQTVSCAITPSDGIASAPTVTLSVTIGGCAADWNGDGSINSGDITAFLAGWLASLQQGTLVADFNSDGQVNSGDITAFLAAWIDALQGGC